MKRRKTVSVTPAIGASTVAGSTTTEPILKPEGTRAASGMVCSNGASHCFFSSVYLFFNMPSPSKEKAFAVDAKALISLTGAYFASAFAVSALPAVEVGELAPEPLNAACRVD